MQPPPRTGPPGASGPPPPSGPNMFRRTRPHKHPAAAATAAMQLATQPMMDPFAFARAPPPIGHLNVPNSSAPPMQSPPNLMYSQSGAGLLPEPQTQEDISAIPPGPPPSSLPGVTLFNPHSMAPPAAFSAPSPSYALPNTEHGYFNSREQPLPMVTEPPTMFTHSAHSQAPFSQEFQGQRPPLSASFQPMPQTTSLSQRAADHGSRPPSVQNYFQPTSDPPPQTFNMPPQTQIYPTHTSPHFNSPTSPVEPAHLQNPAPPPNPVHAPGFEWPDPGRAQQPSSHFQTQNYFSQSGAPPESWVSHPSQVSDYHQMGTSMSHAQPGSFHPQQTSTAEHGASSVPVPALYSQDSGTLSMFFKDNDVENEETLAGERNKALNGVPGSFQHPSNLPAHGGNADVSAGYRRGFPHDNSYIPYMNDGNPLAQENTQKPPDSQPDIVENLECVPNLEVLPSEVPCNPVTTAPHAEDQFETGPNIETPDSVPRPMRSASVSSNYSNMSHGSSTGTRRHQGVVGTFIQQESPRLTDDANRSAATGGYFEQIDTSPAGDAAVQPSTPEHIWQPTPSPPKPTGIFQASANSSFEPVRSQGVGVRPAEVDKAKMVAERATGCVSGNLEQPPDNLENLYSSSHPLPASAGGGAANMTPQAVHSLSRPSSRAFGASRPCDSPATTLWAQTDPTSFGTNILLAPAAPAVLAPLREPTADVIQPPEDGPLDLQPQRLQPNSQHLENLENPPKVSESEATDSQGNVGYASLLVSGSLHQHVLIAPPVSNYGVIPTSTPAPAANQSSPRETLTTTPIRLLVQGPSANNTSQALPVVSNQNPLYVSGPESVSVLASNQNPLNLTRDNTTVPCPEIATQPQPANTCPPLSRAQSVNPESHSAFQVNSQESTVPPPLSNHNPPSNYGLLDFSMHQSQAQGQPSGHPSSLHESPQSSNGFYLQVTKDAQQGARAEGDAPPPASTHLSGQQVPPLPSQAPANTQHAPNEPPKISGSQAPLQEEKVVPPHPVSVAQPPPSQYSSPAQGPTAVNTGPPSSAPMHPPGPRGPPLSGSSQPSPAEPPRPPSSAGSSHGYAPPPPEPGQMYGSYYGSYGDHPDNRVPYPPHPPHPPQYPPPPGDPRAHSYYQDGSYRNRVDPWYGRHEGQAHAYRDPNYQYKEPQPERPSSRTSQYSDRPSSRQGYPDDYNRPNRSAYGDYYADYSKQYDYGYNYGQYDPRYYGQTIWPNYEDAYRARDSYYNQQMYPPAWKEGYEDQWRYYPSYDSSFDDDSRRRVEAYGDDFDRRSIHSEQSAHSVHSSHSQHSRRSSFSSRSQQSQVYRSQPDLVSAVYDTTSSTLAVDYSHGQYPDQTDASQNYSQYVYPSEYPADSTWITPEQPPPRPATPEKFTMPHCCARFGPGGHLVQVLPNLPSAGQPALVDIHNLEIMQQDTPDQVELRSFPGPLVKEETHKVDVIKFSQRKALECSRDNNLLDKSSACLLWEFIVLLCKQNGTAVGTDIAELLLSEHRSVWLPGKSPNETNLIDFNNEPLSRAEEEPGAGPLSLLSDTFMIVPENIGKETEHFRELLLFGRKKDALEAAMKGGLWGHALLLACKMDNRTHASVMTRFANSLPINDPLQTVYQLMSGRMPASATCCGEEKWGDWRPHLAMVLSNLTHARDLDTRTVTTMGDTLASKGLTDAAHFCYLMAQVGLGVFTKKSAKMVLIGSNHSLPFKHFASNEAIQRTEAYEYAQSLGSHPCSLPNFQVFKFIYACRLAESGLSAQAFQYCEVIARTVLMQPSSFSPSFISQIIQMSEKLRFFDPQLKEKPEQELFTEPEWLMHLRQLEGQIRTGVITYNTNRTTPTHFDCSSPSSDMDHPSPPEAHMPPEVEGSIPDNPLMSSVLPGAPPQGVQLIPPAPTSAFQDGMSPPQLLPPNKGPQFYPVPPSGPPGQIPGSAYPLQDPGFAHPPFQPQPEQPEMYPGAHLQQGLPPQMGQTSPHTLSQVPHSPGTHHPPQMPHLMPSSPVHHPPIDQSPHPPPAEMQNALPMSHSPRKNSLAQQMDFYDHMSHMGPGRSRTTSQSSMHMAPGRRSRTTSESSVHSGGRERSNSIIKQVSPPPPSIPEQPREERAKKMMKDSPKKSGGTGWLRWLTWKGKNEAHLPDDKNKSIVWDVKKQKWVDTNEPEKESKPPPPPPSGFPTMGSMPGPAGGGPAAPPSSGPPVNRFSRKAGPRSRYVDILNPSRTAQPGGLAPAPADLFAPLAPMAMPTNLFVPSSASGDQQSLEGIEGGNQEQSSPNSSAAPQMFNPTLLPPAPEGAPVPDGLQSGESEPAQEPAPTGGVTFYNPAQFVQVGAPSNGGQRTGRLGGQRQYPVLK
ncbi:protein transport protein Sec16A isoform X2 [Gouania willdenowi]|uniref:protein transport protein Sec16A isoform X2 n=1 Tax=Gouania willdenowi TaxID=441366 RepID=UPI00105515EA|nr:protein transport protein Sec16A isoform X2 [Gouania willdenowi]